MCLIENTFEDFDPKIKRVLIKRTVLPLYDVKDFNVLRNILLLRVKKSQQ